MSGLAWYHNRGNVDGRRPDVYMDIETDGTVTWEGQMERGRKAPQFHRCADSLGCELTTSQLPFQMATSSGLGLL